MSALIDSILTGHHVPEIVLAKTYDELGEAFYVCVDGKQRLSSIQRFLDGMIPCRKFIQCIQVPLTTDIRQKPEHKSALVLHCA